jgi:hypothetical protein
MIRIFLGCLLLSLIAAGIFLFHVWAHGFWPTVIVWSLSIGTTGLVVLGVWLIVGG